MSEVTAIWGAYNTGKSTMILGWPEPIWIADLELGMKRAVWRVKDVDYNLWEMKMDEEILLNLMLATRGGKIAGRIEQWNLISQEFVNILKEKKYKTIAFDTGKVLWDVDNQSILELRQGDNPNKQTLDPMEYAAPNQRMANIITICQNLGVELVFTNHERDIYARQLIDGQMKMAPTGVKELDGWKQTMDLCDWVVHTECDVTLQSGQTINMTDVTDNRIPNGEFSFKGTIDKSPVGMNLRGRILIDPSYKQLQYLSKLNRQNNEVNGSGEST